MVDSNRNEKINSHNSLGYFQPFWPVRWVSATPSKFNRHTSCIMYPSCNKKIVRRSRSFLVCLRSLFWPVCYIENLVSYKFIQRVKSITDDRKRSKQSGRPKKRGYMDKQKLVINRQAVVSSSRRPQVVSLFDSILKSFGKFWTPLHHLRNLEIHELFFLGQLNSNPGSLQWWVSHRDNIQTVAATSEILLHITLI